MSVCGGNIVLKIAFCRGPGRAFAVLTHEVGDLARARLLDAGCHESHCQKPDMASTVVTKR
jgi:hypothetical protein